MNEGENDIAWLAGWRYTTWLWRRLGVQGRPSTCVQEVNGVKGMGLSICDYCFTATHEKRSLIPRSRPRCGAELEGSDFGNSILLAEGSFTPTITTLETQLKAEKNDFLLSLRNSWGNIMRTVFKLFT